ncbi:arylsulfatase [Pseudomonas sp. BP8]|uniref:arylsulfatase n=1 Tax=Pseudomonas sp. BP8 TaxID=2817864 RepID=UPI001AE5F722|nr:arylsulfatase [Pseudomonas sp. BP8]MBP2261547.1 arylsulfatase [Pseudomonas sp. BP8]HDS1733456.1 arylsulfatase [Pseudomonas putida]
MHNKNKMLQPASSRTRALKRSRLWCALWAAGLAFATPHILAQDLPAPDAPFAGKLGLTPQTSSAPHYAPRVQAPAGSPNVVLVMLDDVGFGAVSAFGGPVQTPTIDTLAQQGLRYNNFHTTAMCSPTRAALLTGRNQHSVGAGVIGEVATGYPGYNGILPNDAATLGRVFRGNGYSTAWFGKNHNTPTFEITPIGPFDHWPNGLGFEYFYGFMGAETNPWAPTLYENTRPVQVPNEPGYHMEKDFAQRAANWIRTQHSLAPNKPFMMYYAPGTAHSPLAAPKEWIARYEGKFDQGWDKLREETFARQKKLGIIPQDAVLTPRPEQIPAWDSLSAEQKRVSARGMEVYAAAISYCDAQLKTLFSTLDELGERDNTLVVFLVGDNGSSAEGGFYGTTNDFYHLNGRPDDFEELLASVDALGSPQTASQFPVGFGWAMNAPFPWFKQVAGHLGGTRNGLIMSWPGHTRQEHQVRSQFASVIDIAPTLYQAAGITAPKRVDGVEQRPLEGVSLLDSLTNPKAPSLHHTQYFEVFANRGIYHDGWLASTTPAKLPWDPPTPISPQDYQWELYDLNKDFSQSHDLAAREPEKLRQMQALFVEQAKRYNVLPLDNRTGPRAAPQNRPNLLNGRSEFTFWRSDERYGATAWPSVMNRSWSLDVQVEPDKDSPDGMIVGDGGLTGGWGLMVLGGKPVLVYRNGATASQEYRVEGPALGKGSHRLQVAFNYDGGGRGKGGTFVLTVDGKRAGEMKIPASLAFLFAEEGATIGRDVGTPLLADYRLPFVFTGEIGPVNIRLQPLSP